MGAGLQRAYAAAAVTRLTDQQRSVLAVMTERWMTADEIAEAAGLGGYSPRETAARIANRLSRDFVLDKGGTRAAPLWRRTQKLHG